MTFYGQFELTELERKIVQNPVFLRLKKINQRGAAEFAKGYKNPFSRYDHSLGVLYLLARNGAGQKARLAGLLHDLSHTVFSHVAEYLFGSGESNSGESYQDRIFVWFLKKTGVADLLEKHGIDPSDVIPSEELHPILEQPLPRLCADRIDYNLQDAVRSGILDRSEAMEIVSELNFNGSDWFFGSVESALAFAAVPIWFSLFEWGAPWNSVCYSAMAKAIKLGIRNKVISEAELNFSDDTTVINKLERSGNEMILNQLERVRDPWGTFKFIGVSAGKSDLKKLLSRVCFEWSGVNSTKVTGLYRKILDFLETLRFVATAEADRYVKLMGKFRGVDPYVRTLSGDLKPLSEIDDCFKVLFFVANELMKRGWLIKFL
jgi:hypothetical protein